MSSFISFLVIIGIILLKALGNRDKADKKKMQTRQAQNNARQQAQRNVAQQRTAQSQRNAQQNAYYYNQQQRATKERLQQKYGSQLKNPASQQPKGDILSRAKENVQENEPDKMQQELHAEVCRDYRDTSHETPDVMAHKMQAHDYDTEAESDIMKKVNDLIVTGYSGDMTFERDFIAEGVEMLNRFNL